jgi:mRNA interferase RelE/StbE
VKTIILMANAAKQFDALPLAIQEQIASALHLYATTGRGDIKALQGQPGYRLRSCRYRILFDEDLQTVVALYIGKRETVTYR